MWVLLANFESHLVEFEMITDDAPLTENGVITDQYTQILERLIIETPELSQPVSVVGLAKYSKQAYYKQYK